jgi:5-methyltetrahydropteroyltriglutamate--homocysteine methyltransferase
VRERWEAGGIDQENALREDIEADNLCLRGLDRRHVTLAIHLCRGNSGRGPGATIRYQRSGGYDWVAEQLFNTLEVDRFLLEYDSDRAGTFEPLRFMPKGKVVVLGLITTKGGKLETPDEIMRRIDEAARRVPIENLALSPQCGFASAEAGNPLTWDEQRRKLELVATVARRVWPEPDPAGVGAGILRG